MPNQPKRKGHQEVKSWVITWKGRSQIGAILIPWKNEHQYVFASRKRALEVLCKDFPTIANELKVVPAKIIF